MDCIDSAFEEIEQIKNCNDILIGIDKLDSLLQRLAIELQHTEHVCTKEYNELCELRFSVRTLWKVFQEKPLTARPSLYRCTSALVSVLAVYESNRFNGAMYELSSSWNGSVLKK